MTSVPWITGERTNILMVPLEAWMSWWVLVINMVIQRLPLELLSPWTIYASSEHAYSPNMNKNGEGGNIDISMATLNSKGFEKAIVQRTLINSRYQTASLRDYITLLKLGPKL